MLPHATRFSSTHCVELLTQRRRALALLLVVWGLLLGAPSAAQGYELLDGDIQFHGFYRAELRALNDGFERKNHTYIGAFAHTLNIEMEWDIAPDGWLFFDSIGAYARAEIRFDCVWADGCGVFNSRQYFGDKPDKVPYKQLATGRFKQKSGVEVFRNVQEFVSQGRELVAFQDSARFQPLLELGTTGLDRILRQIEIDQHSIPMVVDRDIPSSFDENVLTLGPWQRDSKVRALGILRNLPSLTPALPLRPAVPQPSPDRNNFKHIQGTWIPSYELRQKIDQFDDTGRGFDLMEEELRWNLGQSQDERELKEAYLDLEFFDGRLFVRLGKQQIVWGKTELFRNQDQFNPQDVGLALLPSLEESRNAQWSARAIYSLYNIGPFEDVRVEIAAILDDFEPIDAGTCGEPYSIWLVCAGSAGFFFHGLTGLGVAGVDLPPHPWNSFKGVEIGGRLEFRLGRFSFAVSDYYGYNDIPSIKLFQNFERRVDPDTGRPLDALGRPFDFDAEDDNVLEQQALGFHPSNRQLYDFVCAISLDVAAAFIPELAGECAIGVFSSSTPLAAAAGLGIPLSVADAVGLALAGSGFGRLVAQGIIEGGVPTGQLIPLAQLNADLNDGAGLPGSGCVRIVVGDQGCLSEVLTDEQEALLGCGPFYGTNCDVDGVDLFNAEASVLYQAFQPMIPKGTPVATRFVDGEVIILPGARGPKDPGYDPRVDGCPDRDAHPLCATSARAGIRNPQTGQFFDSELQGLSYNFLQVVAGFGAAQDPSCDLNNPVTCSFLRGLLNTVGNQRADMRAGGNGRFGRLDHVWNSGGSLMIQFQKRNVVGFSMDFAEDFTKSNWGVELTWTEDEEVGVSTKRDLIRKVDIYQATISIDRPTFINFLNASRTFFFNTQWFFQYIPEYKRQNVFNSSGPLNILGTFTVLTGYFQDRLQIAATLVHDFPSNSGALLWTATYRFTANFSAELTVRTFYGSPEHSIQPLYPIGVQNDFGDFKSRGRYGGLSVLSEKDEVGISIKYTF